jgi:hypothetical protein
MILVAFSLRVMLVRAIVAPIVQLSSRVNI